MNTPRHVTERPERTRPASNSLTGVGIALLDHDGRVLLGLGHHGQWELPGGKVDPGEGFESAAARELEEETGLVVPPAAVRVLAVLVDGLSGLTRVTAASVTEHATGTARVRRALSGPSGRVPGRRVGHVTGVAACYHVAPSSGAIGSPLRRRSTRSGLAMKARPKLMSSAPGPSQCTASSFPVFLGPSRNDGFTMRVPGHARRRATRTSSSLATSRGK